MRKWFVSLEILAFSRGTIDECVQITISLRVSIEVSNLKNLSGAGPFYIFISN